MTQKTDEEIALQVRQGDVQSFGILVERYEAKISRYAKRFLFGYDDAADVVQEVFMKAYTNLQSFDAARSFSPWLYRIAHNEFINAIRKKGREPLSFFDPDTLFPHPADPRQADYDLKEQELREMLEQCLKQLNPKYREPLVLYFFEEMDYQQIAEILRIPVSTVGVRLLRGRKAIQSMYKKLHSNI
jgi:RNA polymerase sigma-70 factor (ECF subfamily)